MSVQKTIWAENDLCRKLAAQKTVCAENCFPPSFRDEGVKSGSICLSHEPIPMTLCPIALARGCKRCPIFKVCPVKGVIGDYKPEAPAGSPEASPRKRKE